MLNMSVFPVWTYSFLIIFIISAIFCPLGVGSKGTTIHLQRNYSTTPAKVVITTNSSDGINGRSTTENERKRTPPTEIFFSAISSNRSNDGIGGKGNDNKMSAGAVAGVVVVALVVVIAATVGSFFVYKWRKKKSTKKEINLPSANIASRNSTDIDNDIPTERAPPPPKPQNSMNNRPPRPAPLNHRAKLQQTLEPENVYESYEDDTSSRPISYEVPMQRQTSFDKADDTQPRRPPRPKRDKNRFVEVSLNDSVNSNSSCTYDDVDDDVNDDDDDRDSYETPITRSEEHTYRAMFESSITSDNYYTDVKEN